MGKFNVFCVWNDTAKVKIEDNDTVKPVIHAAELNEMFPYIDIDNL